MARPLCAEKREAIILSAINLFYQDGFNAPTSKIAREAKVSEGTIFTYFKSKDDLMSNVYLYLKSNLLEVLLKYFDEHNSKACSLEAIKSSFKEYINYGIAHPERSILLNRYILSKQFPKEFLDTFRNECGAITKLVELIIPYGPMKDAPLDMALSLFANMGNNVIHYCVINDVTDPKLIDQYAEIQFNAYWLSLCGKTKEETEELLKKLAQEQQNVAQEQQNSTPQQASN
ncbi:hypothetical protein CKF54_06975 [Psittacicella hinzii]|uniref:HTH tetR-type domain-containing protein n=1 Tax=Psittacicella hinzii TaxID=2028575 RepID=A0A3A1Y1X7_9GAMM|nr:TetR/AcrR family transcriptional regulator [Psittacicella hinzii]RIY31286.1 hypothetical protein CKF54_06975 [Psittacicella hinzii]